jgi:hypothetical protein
VLLTEHVAAFKRASLGRGRVGLQSYRPRRDRPQSAREYRETSLAASRSTVPNPSVKRAKTEDNCWRPS